ncbi:zinc ribbon domain-containing protein [SAR202 cluster bacterium AC-409-J13_OGT_754m]|nr:zinc ribbon domain-containing protein [SAR202 cluster bacterium AC-409-J13_OGT_754m]
MPIYEYICDECDSRFDRLQPTGTTHSTCPSCFLPARKALSLFSAISTNRQGESSAVSGMGGCPGCAGGSCACAG